MKKSYVAFLLLIIVLPGLAYFAGRHSSSGNGSDSGAAHRVLYYVDPMHPAYKSDKPGIAPDCGMQLEAVYSDGAGATGAAAADLSTMPAGTVNINASQQQLIGLRLATVEKTSGTRNVRLLGKVAADEERTYRLTAGVDGFIEEIFGNPTGTFVKTNQRLATFRSQDFFAALQTYISALAQAPQFKNEVVGESDWRNQTAKLAYGRLRSLGVTEDQMKQISSSRVVSDSLDIVSPSDGFVVARNITPGQRVDKGSEFYRIVDLSKVVIYADAFENEAQYFRPGVVATIRLSGGRHTNAKPMRATVSKVLPQFDGATRTMKLRMEADNPGYVLRPDMFVDVELPVATPTGLSVPVEALLDSGTTKRVFVEIGNGAFAPRQVETGIRVGDQVQIISGLDPGERVVASGTFLVDSESRLKQPAVAEPRSSTPAVTAKLKTVAQTGRTQSIPKSAKDPKCGMDVTPADSIAAGLTLDHKGTSYYFCSKTCKEAFQANPEKFLANGHTDAMHD